MELYPLLYLGVVAIEKGAFGSLSTLKDCKNRKYSWKLNKIIIIILCKNVCLQVTIPYTNFPYWLGSLNMLIAHLQRGNSLLKYDSKLCNGDALVLELWEMQSTLPLPLIPGPLWSGMIDIFLFLPPWGFDIRFFLSGG